ncbi:hypothetical protein JW935_05640 [candidate division KSB1 bacterium]|nr:hypothetical protein [candidate division KSB1 bacterium]
MKTCCSAMLLVCSVFFQLVVTSGFSQIIISDGTYNESDWRTFEYSEFGATQVTHQFLAEGNPGAFLFMAHILPVPSDPVELTRMEVGHILSANSYTPFQQGAIEYMIIQKTSSCEPFHGKKCL